MIIHILLFVVCIISCVICFLNEIKPYEEENLSFDYVVFIMFFTLMFYKYYNIVDTKSILYFALFYIAIGFIYSIAKSYIWCNKTKNKLIKDFKNEHFKPCIENKTNSIKEKLFTLIPLWIVWWPIYLLFYIIKDLIEFVVNKYRFIYEYIFNKFFKNIEIEINDILEKDALNRGLKAMEKLK